VAIHSSSISTKNGCGEAFEGGLVGEDAGLSGAPVEFLLDGAFEPRGVPDVVRLAADGLAGGGAGSVGAGGMVAGVAGEVDAAALPEGAGPDRAGEGALRAATRPVWSPLVMKRTPRRPRDTRLSRKPRQWISASDSATEIPSTLRLPSSSMLGSRASRPPIADRMAASRTTPSMRTFS